MGDLLEKTIRKNQWDILDTEQKLDKLFEVIDGLQDYLDYHIPKLNREIWSLKNRIDVLEKGQDKLFSLIRYSKT